MKRILTCNAVVLVCALIVSTNITEAQAQSADGNGNRQPEARAEFHLTNLLARARRQRRPLFSLPPETRAASAFSVTPTAGGPSLPVMGSGTIGRMSKWTGATSSNSFIGDSIIFEDKFGKVGIGTDSPASKLTVAGMIQSTGGGFKFPDGTVQTTSASGALFSVAHDATLTGNGTTASPLGVAVPLVLSSAVSFPDAVFRATSTTPGIGVLGITQGAVPSPSSIQPSGVSGFAVGGTGVLGGSTSGPGVIGRGMIGVVGQGNFDSPGPGGLGVIASGGGSVSGFGGFGVDALGGGSGSGIGGTGIRATGGNSSSSFGGDGIEAIGGNSNTNDAGRGVKALGGNASLSGSGGSGVRAVGGLGRGAGNAGGSGIFARFGSGVDGATDGPAGIFEGDVEIILGNLTVDGNLSVTGTKMFRIDHPLDPENKYLNHAAIESSEVLNVYSGNITTDQNGDAVVSLPEWFEALNKDFRYQLTVIGAFAQAIVADEIKDNSFIIRTNAPGVKVSWQVTGVRNDRGMRRHQFKVEEEKSERERGHYLRPEAFNQPVEKSIEHARDRR